MEENKDLSKHNQELDTVRLEGIQSSFSKINETTAELSKQIEKQKEEIIKKKLEERSIKIDIDKDLQQRFPMLLIEKQVGTESVYYNDGTPEGERIVTFEISSDTKFGDVFTGTITLKHF